MLIPSFKSLYMSCILMLQCMYLEHLGVTIWSCIRSIVYHLKIIFAMINNMLELIRICSYDGISLSVCVHLMCVAT